MPPILRCSVTWIQPPYSSTSRIPSHINWIPLPRVSLPESWTKSRLVAVPLPELYFRVPVLSDQRRRHVQHFRGDFIGERLRLVVQSHVSLRIHLVLHVRSGQRVSVGHHGHLRDHQGERGRPPARPLPTSNPAPPRRPAPRPLQHYCENGYPRSYLERFTDECTDTPRCLFASSPGRRCHDDTSCGAKCSSCLHSCLPFLRPR